eukprot:6543695-Prymnesium_polylepis.1
MLEVAAEELGLHRDANPSAHRLDGVELAERVGGGEALVGGHPEVVVARREEDPLELAHEEAQRLLEHGEALAHVARDEERVIEVGRERAHPFQVLLAVGVDVGRQPDARVGRRAARVEEGDDLVLRP